MIFAHLINFSQYETKNIFVLHLFHINLHYVRTQFSPCCLICISKDIFKMITCYSSGVSGKMLIQKALSYHWLCFSSLWIPRSANLHHRTPFQICPALLSLGRQCRFCSFLMALKRNKKCQLTKRPKNREN